MLPRQVLWEVTQLEVMLSVRVCWKATVLQLAISQKKVCCQLVQHFQASCLGRHVALIRTYLKASPSPAEQKEPGAVMAL